MSTTSTPPPGDHIHFPEVEWPVRSPPFVNLAVTFQMLDTIGDHATQAAQLRPREIPLPIGMIEYPELPPMADERFAHPLEPESHVAAYILLALALLGLAAVVARAEGWL